MLQYWPTERRRKMWRVLCRPCANWQPTGSAYQCSWMVSRPTSGAFFHCWSSERRPLWRMASTFSSTRLFRWVRCSSNSQIVIDILFNRIVQAGLLSCSQARNQRSLSPDCSVFFCCSSSSMKRYGHSLNADYSALPAVVLIL